MNKLKNLTLTALISASPIVGMAAAPVIYNTPSGFQALKISSNGKWACGNYADASQAQYGFRWNLESGKIEMLDSKNESVAWAVSNDGTVSGNFSDKTLMPNGAPVQIPGYWRDGKWHRVELPDGVNVSDGLGFDITPDGHYMSGSLYINGIYTPYIWKDGAIYKVLENRTHGMPYAIRPDGQGAGGWVMGTNRTACYWAPDGTEVLLTDSPEWSYSMWNTAQAFSSDGSKMLYWGGWDVDGDDETGDLYLYSIYDTNTDERKRIKASYMGSDMKFFDISDSGVCVGEDTGRGYLYLTSEDKCMYVDEYLQMRGVDLSDFDGFYSGSDWSADELPVLRVQSISDDDNVLNLLYYDQLGQMCSMIVKIDVDTEAAAPVSVAAQQLPGLNNVAVKWEVPNNMLGCRFNVYRDGNKVSGLMGVRTPYFYDKNVQDGTHEYSVELITPSGSNNMSDPVSVTVSSQSAAAPLAVSARQKGVNGAFVNWDAPLSNKAVRSFVDYNTLELEAFSVYAAVEMEAAVKYDSHDMANYAGQYVQEVSFIPMADQNSWALNFYTEAENGELTLVASQPVTQPLVYKERNVVKLDNPVPVPTEGNLLVAVAVSTNGVNTSVLGAHIGSTEVGYSDLLRQSSEATFFSAYESSVADGYNCSCMKWAIDLIIAPEDYSAENDQVASYNIYDGDVMVGASTDLSASIASLEDGAHSIGVQAVYTNGAVSEINYADVTIAASCLSATDVNVEVATDSPDILVTWQAPVDNDVTSISYATGTRSAKGVKGTSSNGYALMAAVDYPSAMLKPYLGYEISSLRFYPMCDALFSLIVYENEEEVAFIEVEDYTLNRWNEVPVDLDLVIKPGCDYRFVVDCFDPVPDTNVLGVDAYPSILGVSDLYSIDNGESFSNLLDAGLNNNWMMGMMLSMPDGQPANVAGYGVRMDGKQRNEDLLTDCEFAYTFPEVDTKDHLLVVDTYYPGTSKKASTAVTRFNLSTGSLADEMVAEISIYQGNNLLVAEGEGVLSISVYSVSGVCMASAQGNTVNVSDLTAGVYAVSVNTASGVVTRKLIIK